MRKTKRKKNKAPPFDLMNNSSRIEHNTSSGHAYMDELNSMIFGVDETVDEDLDLENRYL